MPFNKKLPEWKAAGIQPPESKRIKGWEVEDRPPADWLNWQMNTTYEALQELHEKAAEKDDVSKALKDAKEYTDKKALAITPESIGAETPAGAQSKADAAKQDAEQKIADHAGDAQVHVSTTDRQEWDGAANEVTNALAKELTFTPGLQVVESEQDVPFQMGNIKGRTLINLLGRAGDCESTADWLALGTGIKTLSSERVYGSYSIEAASTKEEQAGFGLRSNGAVKDLNKYYVAVGHVRNLSAQFVYLSFAQVKDNGNTAWFKKGTTVTANQFTYTYVAVSPADLADKDKVEVYVRGETSGSGQKIAADGIGLYEITQAEYDAIAKMTPEQVAERYPYVDSMTNVKNPYVIVTGGNLLPPFTDGWSIASQAKVLSLYHLLLSPESNYNGTYVSIPCVGNTTYTLQGTVTGGGKLYADVRGSNGSHEYYLVENGSITFTTVADSTVIDVLCTNDTTIAGNMEFRDVMLTFGTDPKPFTPQQRSMIAFETELAAHPVDGSNPDTLFMGDDGLPYVLEPWNKVTLDGSLSYRLGTKTTAWKQVYFDISQGVIDSEIVIKFNGSRLTSNQYMDGPDQSAIDSVDKTRVYLTIANTDSGWGPDYTPTADEIKAYFLGWKMYDGRTNSDGTGVYNRADGVDKRWCKIGSWNGAIYTYGGASTVPTDGYKDYPYTPYRLQYLKAKPTVEPVRNYELGATLSAGSNMVEVGSGIVIRERANPKPSSGLNLYGINHPGAYGVDANLKNKAREIVRIYRNQAKDALWFIYNNASVSYGNVYADIYSHDYDPTAVYHVTYTMLDPTLAAPINGTVAANLRGTVSDLVQDVGDVQRRLSVVETQKAEKDAPGWITPTLLNGWVGWGERWAPPQYYKDDNGIVHLRGLVKGGVIDGGKAMFVLPKGYRPSHSSAHVSYSQGAGVTEVNGVIARIDVSGETGSVYPTRGSNELFSLEGISFRAER